MESKPVSFFTVAGIADNFLGKNGLLLHLILMVLASRCIIVDVLKGCVSINN